MRAAVRITRRIYLAVERSPLRPLLSTRPVEALKARVTRMPGAAVCSVLGLLESAGVTVSVAGGWGVDALLGVQTRPHYDVDLLVPAADAPAARSTLLGAGYHLEREEHNEGLPMPLRWIMADDLGHVVDLLPLDRSSTLLRDEDPRVLFGSGTIDGRPVRCLSAEAQLQLHAGYPLRPVDRSDIARLEGVRRAYCVGDRT